MNRLAQGSVLLLIGLGAILSGAAEPEHPLLHKIRKAALDSSISNYAWADRGRAPIGYYKGLALSYGRVYCKFKANDPAAVDMASAATGPGQDGLAYYQAEFNKAGMSNNQAGVDTLRHLFVMLTGLGMRESSGRYCEGRDRSAENTTAETAEAGLFQTSFDSSSASPLLSVVFKDYEQHPSGFLEAFREGVECSAQDLENYGSGEGREFQRLSKACPAFAVEFAGVGLRHVRKHWGPVNRREVEIRPESDELFREVERLVDETPEAASALR
ncbi:hypothetical protein JST97_20040 [bacterium]|nr:hypothetical protein [bacterium]